MLYPTRWADREVYLRGTHFIVYSVQASESVELELTPFVAMSPKDLVTVLLAAGEIKAEQLAGELRRVWWGIRHTNAREASS